METQSLTNLMPPLPSNTMNSFVLFASKHQAARLELRL